MRTPDRTRSPAITFVVAMLAACAGPTGPTPQSTAAPTQQTARPPATPGASPTDTPTSSPETTPHPPSASPASPAETSPGSPSPDATFEPTVPPASAYVFEEFDVPARSHPHDVAPAPDGTVWYTGQGSGELGRLDPATGEVAEVALGAGSAPHGVIIGPDGAPWITDGGRNEISRVDPATLEVTRFPLPGDEHAGLNTAAFDGRGTLWFTGQSGGVYGRVVPATGSVEVFEAPRGAGPYGIDATPEGEAWFVSLAGSYLARIDSDTGAATVFDPPTAGQGARRVWSDSAGRLWVSEWNAGQLGMYDPQLDAWREWPLPGPAPQPYSVYVDDLDLVWLTDFASNSIVRFDPAMEAFAAFPIPTRGAAIRQQLGRPTELWGAESAADKLVVLRTTE